MECLQKCGKQRREGEGIEYLNIISSCFLHFILNDAFKVPVHYAAKLIKALMFKLSWALKIMNMVKNIQLSQNKTEKVNK